jgi:hypothetical protein
MDELVINHFARFELLVADNTITLTVLAPVRGQQLRRSVIHDPPKPLLELIKHIESREVIGFLADKDCSILFDLGIIVSKDQLPQQVVLSFQRTNEGDRYLLLPTLRESASTGLKIQAPLGMNLVKVHDPVRKTWFPRLIDDHCFEIIEQLEADLDLSNLLPEHHIQLVDEGILVPLSSIESQTGLWNRALQIGRQELARNGYTVIPSLFPADLVHALSRYYQSLASEGFLSNESVCGTRYTLHREPLAEYLHQSLAELLSPLLGDCGKPSYSFVSIYYGGSDLPLHSDREACEVTVSVCVAANKCAVQWPLVLHPLHSDSSIELRLGIGNAAIFTGRTIAHERPPLAEDGTFTTLLFHFVRQDFEGSLD